MIDAGMLSRVAPGFDDVVVESQSMFRLCLSAMAQPGRILAIDGISLKSVPAGLHRSAAAVLLALLDQDTTIWLPPSLSGGDCATFLRFHTGCGLAAEPGRATFALVDDPAALPPLTAFAQGSEAYPDRSSTVLLQCDGLRERRGWLLRGPGIRDVTELEADGAPSDFPERWAANRSAFPRGVDLFLLAPEHLAALPRTVRLEA